MFPLIVKKTKIIAGFHPGQVKPSKSNREQFNAIPDFQLCTLPKMAQKGVD